MRAEEVGMKQESPTPYYWATVPNNQEFQQPINVQQATGHSATSQHLSSTFTCFQEDPEFGKIVNEPLEPLFDWFQIECLDNFYF